MTKCFIFMLKMMFLIEVCPKLGLVSSCLQLKLLQVVIVIVPILVVCDQHGSHVSFVRKVVRVVTL
jgi:hypothetical protein